MALGGGTFTVQNKNLPGAYINFVAAKMASSIFSERGIVALGLELGWMKEKEVTEITSEDFLKNTLAITGHHIEDSEILPLREIFKNARKIILYRLNSGVTASNTFATALYTGVRGNKLKTVIRANVAEPAKFDVLTYFDDLLVDSQTVTKASDLVKNQFCTFKPSATLAVNAGLPFTGGTNGTSATGAEYQAMITKLESYSFNTIACASETAEITALIVAYTKRMRDELGVKFQAVLYKNAADYEGVVSVENAPNLVYWVAGALAGANANESLTNRIYDGELTVSADYTQVQLTEAIKNGKFIFHRVGSTIRVLDDVNTLVTLVDDKSNDFKINQTIRVIDLVGNDTAAIFNDKYLGQIPNDEAGRVSLWSDVVSYLQELQEIRAIENFNPDSVIVAPGAEKKAVVVNFTITPISAMTQLYMTVVIE